MYLRDLAAANDDLAQFYAMSPDQQKAVVAAINAGPGLLLLPGGVLRTGTWGALTATYPNFMSYGYYDSASKTVVYNGRPMTLTADQLSGLTQAAADLSRQNNNVNVVFGVLPSVLVPEIQPGYVAPAAPVAAAVTQTNTTAPPPVPDSSVTYSQSPGQPQAPQIIYEGGGSAPTPADTTAPVAPAVQSAGGGYMGWILAAAAAGLLLANSRKGKKS